MGEAKAHILLIDDDASILEMMRLILEDEGYRVTTTEIVFEEITAVERLQPDVIIMDFLMHGRQTGWTFLQKLKLYRPTAGIPVVICTAALAEVREQEPILTQKGIPLLYKPFHIDEMLHIVEQTLSSS